MKVTDGESEAFIEDLRATLNEVKVPETEQEERSIEEAHSVAGTSGDTQPAVKARSGLAQGQLQLGDPAAALVMTAVRPELPFPAGEPAARFWKGWLGSSCIVPRRVLILSGWVRVAAGPVLRLLRRPAGLHALRAHGVLDGCVGPAGLAVDQRAARCPKAVA